MNIREVINLVESLSNVNESTLFGSHIEALFEKYNLDFNILLENRIEFLKTNTLPKLQPMADKEGVSLDELFDVVLSQDGSPKKIYTQWMLTQLIKGKSEFKELNGLGYVLKVYDSLKRNKEIEGDIGKLSFKDVRNIVAANKAEEENQLSKEEQKARDECDLISNTDKYLVIVPKTEYAAGYYGSNSLWCTSAGYGRQKERSNNMFDRYNEEGKMYIIINKKDPKILYQIHIPTNQFMNSENRAIDDAIANEIIGELPELVEDIYTAFSVKVIRHFIKEFDLTNLITDAEKERLKKYWETLDTSTLSVEDAYELITSEELPPKDISDKLLQRIAIDAKHSYEYASEVIRGRFELGENTIATDAKYSCLYARDVIKGRFELGEKAIATSAEYSYEYARDALNGRFEDGEKAIATDAEFSYEYARDVIEGQFELGEKAIATSAELSYEYARDALKGRFELGEKAIATSTELSYKYSIIAISSRFELGEEAIAKDAQYSCNYAEYIIEGRFELGEKVIATNASYSYKYAKGTLKGRFELGEKVIATEAVYSYLYAKDVIKGRFELGEKAIATHAECSSYYAEVIKGRFELGEKAIATEYSASINYAENIIKGRFELGEKAIATDASSSYQYATEVLNGRFELGEPVIATEAKFSYYYAINIIKGRFELGEKAIASHAEAYIRYKDKMKELGIEIE